MGKKLAEGHRYYCFIEGYSIYKGTASTLYCRGANLIIVVIFDAKGCLKMSN